MVEYYFSKVAGLHFENLLKQDPTTGAFPKTFRNVSIAIFIYLWTVASEFTDNSHSFYLFLVVPLVWEDKEEGVASSELPWSYNNSMELHVQNLVANNALI